MAPPLHKGSHVYLAPTRSYLESKVFTGMAPSAPLVAPAGAITAANCAVFACSLAPSCFMWSQNLKWLPQLPQKLL